jgi:hypothetical protein
MLKKAALFVTLASALAACSGHEDAPAPEAATPAPETPRTPRVEAPVIADTSLISLPGPGFAQVVSSGTAGGPIAGQTMSRHCVGNFPTSGQHTITVAQAIPHVRIVVNAGPSDTTLAVRLPSGDYACGDDSDDPANSLNPFVDLEDVQPGTYQVFVGGYSGGDAWASYALGVTEGRALPSEIVPAP